MADDRHIGNGWKKRLLLHKMSVLSDTGIVHFSLGLDMIWSDEKARASENTKQ